MIARSRKHPATWSRLPDQVERIGTRSSSSGVFLGRTSGVSMVAVRDPVVGWRGDLPEGLDEVIVKFASAAGGDRCSRFGLLDSVLRFGDAATRGSEVDHLCGAWLRR